MVHNQSDVPLRPIIPYSRQLLHTRTLQARQKAPRFIIRPSSDRHRPQLLFGSMFHNPRLFVKLRLPPPPARLALFGGGWWWPLAKRPLFRSMASSDFNRLQQKKFREINLRKKLYFLHLDNLFLDLVILKKVEKPNCRFSSNYMYMQKQCFTQWFNVQKITFTKVLK